MTKVNIKNPSTITSEVVLTKLSSSAQPILVRMYVLLNTSSNVSMVGPV